MNVPDFSQISERNTLSMISLFAEIGCLALAVFSGILAFRYLNNFLKLLFLQVVVWGIFYAIATVLTAYQTANGEQINDQWLINIHLLFETGILLAAARLILREGVVRFFPLIIAFAFLAVYILQAVTLGYGKYLHYADLASCIGLSIVFTIVLFRIPSGSDWLPMRVACIALLVYFGCSVPFVSMMDYLQQHAPKVNSLLYHIISDVVANLRYGLTAFAFILTYRSKKINQLHHG